MKKIKNYILAITSAVSIIYLLKKELAKTESTDIDLKNIYPNPEY